MKGHIVKFFALLFAVLSAGTAFGGIIPGGNSSFEDSGPGFGSPSGWTLFTDSASPTFSSNAQVVTNNGSEFPLVAGVAGIQFAALDIDPNETKPTNPTPII